MLDSIVSGVLTRFLGDYFENLSNLNLSIWQGDITLSNIGIKSTAFNHFKLPFRVVAGNVGKLQVKLPWKYISKMPVEIVLKDLCLVAVPSSTVPYDQHAEEEAAFTYKKSQVEYLEETYKAVEQHGTSVVALALASEAGGSTTTTPSTTTAAEGSYSARLIAGIIRNVQITIQNIHIRYEDDIPAANNASFSFGIVLSSLKIAGTNSEWVPTFIVDEAKTEYKTINLQGLAVYINSGENLTTSNKTPSEATIKADIIQKLDNLINSNKGLLNYIVGPISTTIHVKLTEKPQHNEPPFTIPKTVADIVMDSLTLGISSIQFKSILYLCQSIEFMVRTHTWRKYRPNLVGFAGHYKEWWKFAIKCVLVEIKRKRANWSWTHMKDFRLLSKLYVDMHTKVLLREQLSSANKTRMKSAEEQMDVINIVLLRRQAELKFQRLPQNSRRDTGWLGSFMDWNGATDPAGEVTTTTNPHAPWTHEERLKIVGAVHYCENVQPLQPIDYPSEYVAVLVDFCLKKLDLIIRDENNKKGTQILQMKIENLEKRLELRPSNNGIKFEWKMKSIEIFGAPAPSKVGDEIQPPYLMRSKNLKSDQNFFEICYEKFPVDFPTNEKILLSTNAIEVIYQATTINHLLRCFSTPEEIQIYRLQEGQMTLLQESQKHTRKDKPSTVKSQVSNPVANKALLVRKTKSSTGWTLDPASGLNLTGSASGGTGNDAMDIQNEVERLRDEFCRLKRRVRTLEDDMSTRKLIEALLIAAAILYGGAQIYIRYGSRK